MMRSEGPPRLPPMSRRPRPDKSAAANGRPKRSMSAFAALGGSARNLVAKGAGLATNAIGRRGSVSTGNKNEEDGYYSEEDAPAPGRRQRRGNRQGSTTKTELALALERELERMEC